MIDRYDLSGEYDFVMIEIDDGDYVLYSDYEALESKLAALVEAAEVFRKEAVVLSADYLKAFEAYRDDDCIQGWDKARWIRALDTEDKLKAAIAAAKEKGDRS